MRNYIRTLFVSVTALLIGIDSNAAIDRSPMEWTLSSPDKKVTLTVKKENNGTLSYTVYCGKNIAIEPSRLGLIMDEKSIGDNAEFISESKSKEIKVNYSLKVGKQLSTTDHCMEKTLSFKDKSGLTFDIVMRAYNDGAAFRYAFTGKDNKIHTIQNELTEFAVPTNGKAWTFPYMTDERNRPCYEEYAEYEIPIRSKSKQESGWAFPMLFNTNGLWMLITEAEIDGNYPATHVDNSGKNNAYKIRFPEKEEAVYPNDKSEPASTLPWKSPWRSIIVGKDLNTIFSSQMVTHLNPRSVIEDQSWIKAGRSSWSWWSEKKPRSYKRQTKYADLSKEMTWEYILVDDGWTEMKDGGTMEDVVKYANNSGVNVWLWYASGAGKESDPAMIMIDPDLRKKEMKRISQLGVKGVKIDFFDTDKQRVMKLYIDILKDAIDNRLMVNFHGSTLPRGLERTYPNLMSMEAVKGAENLGRQEQCDAAPAHNTVLPFTRNVVGPMDYTPVTFSIKNPKRNGVPRTSYAHQVALSVVFESGFQCFADKEQVYHSLPDKPKEFLKKVPCAWDESRLVSGYPGDHVIVLRRKGDQWYIAGISGKREKRKLSFTLPDEFRNKKLVLITDGANGTSFGNKTITVNGTVTVDLLEDGGFAGILQ
ncbi:glycoside hydrolase family 97 protein [Coprobacter secundus]|uniref:glycoside hydrolase family 97 protein n=1 Tax=Coprobacter secundus TaxID=1501392 RepID=UPI0023F9E82A|nr:glycoside hydrolase family 97 protein [Coprobacter secundus]